MLVPQPFINLVSVPPEFVRALNDVATSTDNYQQACKQRLPVAQEVKDCVVKELRILQESKVTGIG